MARTFTAHSALGQALLFRAFSGHEQISRLFEYRLRLLSGQPDVAAKSLLGQDLSVEVDLATARHGPGRRFLSGLVAAFAFAGRDGDFYAYEAVLRPWLWLATRRSDYRIFQFQSVPHIIRQVLAPYGFAIDERLTGHYRQWDYCVQYGESDFNFVSRLLEQEGACYWFEHALGSHKLVLSDGIGGPTPLPAGAQAIGYYPPDRAVQVREEDVIDEWSALEDIASGRFAADDYDFTKPRALLDTRQQQAAGHSFDSGEIFAWPGGYREVADGENYARIRIEQQAAERQLMHAAGNARNLAPGHLFTLARHPRQEQNQPYLIESAQYRFEENVRRSSGPEAGADTPTLHRVSIRCVPARLPWRSQRVTPKPRTAGPQTARVVGPPGEEIYTDQYGRVKVQFHWDRYGKDDENSSCWIRVSSPWAGSNWGAIHIPRIGQEVVVDFLNGDPDQPIITGRVYNAMQMPPWELPENKTQSGLLTRSSKGGTPGHGQRDSPGMANAIRFEDKAGAEQLWLHAQRDQLSEVERDEDKWVGQDRRKAVDRDEFSAIRRDRTEIVDRNEKINVHGWRAEEVDLDETITIHKNRSKTVDDDERDHIGGSWNIRVGQQRHELVGLLSSLNVGIGHAESLGVAHSSVAGVERFEFTGVRKDEVVLGQRTAKVGSDTLAVEDTQYVRARKIQLQADEEILINCGSSVIRLTPNLIEILANLVKLNC